MFRIWNTVEVLTPWTELWLFVKGKKNTKDNSQRSKKERKNSFETGIKSHGLESTKVWSWKEHQRGKNTKHKPSNVYEVSDVW